MPSSNALTIIGSQAISNRPRAFQSYPWLTGVPLVEGKMQEAIDEGIADLGGIDDNAAKLLSVCP
jgi:hypothetical protein